MKKLLKVCNPDYVYLKLMPNKSIRNNQAGRLLDFVAAMYVDFWDRIDIRNRVYNKKSKIAYYIYLRKTKVEFYFIVPSDLEEMFIQRIYDVWKNLVTVMTVDSIPMFERFSYSLNYKFEDALSLKCDNRDNDLIASILNATKMMHDEDEAGIIFNFSPVYQRNWIIKYNKTLEKIKNDNPYYKNKLGAASIGSTVVDVMCKSFDNVLGRPTEKQSLSFSISENTLKKKQRTVVETQIGCASNNVNVANAVCEAFRIIDDDNMIIKTRCNTKFDYHAYRLNGGRMLISPQEAQNFVSLPADSLLKQFKIEHTEIIERKVPEELQKGYICLGANTYQGVETKAYSMDHVEIGAMPLVIIGEQGSGKSTYTATKYVKDAQSRGEGCVVIDYIKSCEFCDEITNVVPKENIVVIDLSDPDQMQGMGYNELKPESNKVNDIVSCANMKAMYISRLVDALEKHVEPLSPRMDKYLCAASNIVMLNESASFKDVMRCLNDYSFRDKCIKNIRPDVALELAEEINDLRELDEIDKKTGKGDTKYSKIEGVNDRVFLLKKDYRLKKMFFKGCDTNVDLVDCMEKGKVVLIKMPQIYFSTPYSRNAVVTYFFTKIWAASIVRGMMHKVPKRCHVIVDEIFQCETTMDLLQEEQILPQTRKYQTKFIFTSQYADQIKKILSTIDAAGASYMLLKGSSGQSNFDVFKNMISPFTLEDLQTLKQFDSLNIMNTSEGKKAFITTLPY